MTASGGSFDVTALTNGDLAKATLLPAAPLGERSWIQYEFARPQTFGGLTLITNGGGGGGRGGGASNQNWKPATTGSSSAPWLRSLPERAPSPLPP